MGITLFDRETDEIVFDINFWNYRAIVEAVRSLGALPEETVDALHEAFQQTGLTTEEARRVGAALRTQLLPALRDDERLLLDGTRTTTPDDGTFYREPSEQHRNYGASREALEKFTRCCETCNGFWVC